MNSVEVIAQSLTKANADIDQDELIELMQHAQIDPKDVDKTISTYIYIQRRMIEKQSRYLAFKGSFPKRCIPDPDANAPFPNTTGEVSRTAIEIKAKRLEQSSIYKKIVANMQASLYLGYFLKRMTVLDHAYEQSVSENVSDRDKAPFMKIFLEETRKPVEAKGMEVNMSFGDDSTLKSIEENMTAISKKLDGKSADEIIDVLFLPKETE